MMFRRAKVCLFIAVLSISVQSAWSADRIYSVRPDGSDLRIEVDSDLVDDSMTYSVPKCSPDGTRLIFDAAPKADKEYSNSKLIVLVIEGKSKGMVEDLDYGKSPSWSPDGTKIAFALYPNNPKGFEAGSWVIDADGTNPVFVSHGIWPNWAPDGKSLITKNFNNNGQFLLKVDIATKESEPFLADYVHLKQIHCSPDGKRVLANILDKGMKRLVTMTPDGARDSIIELATGDIENGRYSLDGESICYTMNSDAGGNELFVISANGKIPAKKLAVLPGVRKQHCFWLKQGPRIAFCAPNDLLVSGK